MKVPPIFSNYESLDRKSIFSAVGSIFFGTLIFTAFYITEYIGIALFGLLFLIFAFVININLLIQIILRLSSESVLMKNYILALGLLILNIPIAIIYFKLATNIIFNNVAMD